VHEPRRVSWPNVSWSGARRRVEEEIDHAKTWVKPTVLRAVPEPAPGVDAERVRAAIAMAHEASARRDGAEDLRSTVVFVAGAGTAVVTGQLGAAGALAQSGIDVLVDRRGSPSDKIAFGHGQVAGGVIVFAQGALESGGGSAAEVGSAGAASVVAVPAVAVGVQNMVVGAAHVTSGAALVARGAVERRFAEPGARGSIAQGGRAPRRVEERHVLAGEVKTKAGSREASGFHLERANPNARIVRGTRTPTDHRGVYRASVEIRDPKSGLWVRKREVSSFFPKNFRDVDVRRAIDEAYANAKPTPRGVLRGKTSQNMMIEIVEREPGVITTAYPVYEGDP
jgi:hypothetical protein